MEDNLARPFLKWVGGKNQLVNTLTTFFPPEIRNGKITRYVEPFLGGGALFFHLAQNYPSIKNFFLSDLNAELILVYKTIRDEVEKLISYLAELEKVYQDQDHAQQKIFFYQIRMQFNQSDLDANNLRESGIIQSARFIFLNRTCFNGLFRVNARGKFNVPVGNYLHPRICDAENLRAGAKILQKAEISCANFLASSDLINDQTLVYFDPPYRPLNKTANFTAYAKYTFDDSNQRRLAEYYRLLTARGAKLMLSNSDPKNIDPQDNFFEDIYAGFQIERIDAARMIN